MRYRCKQCHRLLGYLLISKHRNQPASDPDDPKDWDGNGAINLLDARGCVLACTYPRCASSGPRVGGLQVNAAQASPQGTVGQPGACFRPMISTVMASRISSAYSNMSAIKLEATTGICKRSSCTRMPRVTPRWSRFPIPDNPAEAAVEIFQHLSVQPAGVVDLMPGKVDVNPTRCCLVPQ